MTHLTKTETSLVMWLNVVDRSLPYARTHARRRPYHLSMTRSGQCHAKHAENAVLVYNTCLDKSAAVYKAYVIGTGKLKQQISK